MFISKSATLTTGHCADLIGTDTYTTGLYKLQFGVGKYFGAKLMPTLYPFVEVIICFTKCYFSILKCLLHF